MRNYSVEIKVKLSVNVWKENLKIDDVLNDLDYSFSSCPEGAAIEETEILDFVVTRAQKTK